MSSTINLILGGVTVAFEASHEIAQDYEPLESSGILRMSDGTGVKQTFWSGKTKITTRGNGRFPPGLLGLDYSGSLSMSCVTPRAVDSASNVITVPAARRSDVSMIGLALVNGRSVPTGISLVDNTATLTTVSGAAAYQVLYFPTFIVYAQRPSESNNARSWGQHGWTLVAEEV